MVNETMAVSAAVEPMLIKESRAVIARETRTEFKGIFHPGLTCLTDYYCAPRLILQVSSYMAKEFAERYTIITSKGP